MFFQNRQLQSENKALKEHTTNLATEKQELERRLADSTSADYLQALVKGSVLESRGSAVPFVSQQQKQVLNTLLFQAWMTVR